MVAVLERSQASGFDHGEIAGSLNPFYFKNLNKSHNSFYLAIFKSC